ncbi:MAG: zf-HC2 domain-containing protein [Pirellula sp.]
MNSSKDMREPFDESLLTAYLDNEVTDRERELVQEHLVRTPTARQLLDELRAVRRLVQEVQAPAMSKPIAGGPWNNSHSASATTSFGSAQVVPASIRADQAGRPFLQSLLSVAALLAIVFTVGFLGWSSLRNGDTSITQHSKAIQEPTVQSTSDAVALQQEAQSDASERALVAPLAKENESMNRTTEYNSLEEPAKSKRSFATPIDSPKAVSSSPATSGTANPAAMDVSNGAFGGSGLGGQNSGGPGGMLPTSAPQSESAPGAVVAQESSVLGARPIVELGKPVVGIALFVEGNRQLSMSDFLSLLAQNNQETLSRARGQVLSFYRVDTQTEESSALAADKATNRIADAKDAVEPKLAKSLSDNLGTLTVNGKSIEFEIRAADWETAAKRFQDAGLPVASKQPASGLIDFRATSSVAATQPAANTSEGRLEAETKSDEVIWQYRQLNDVELGRLLKEKKQDAGRTSLDRTATDRIAGEGADAFHIRIRIVPAESTKN